MAKKASAEAPTPAEEPTQPDTTQLEAMNDLLDGADAAASERPDQQASPADTAGKEQPHAEPAKSQEPASQPAAKETVTAQEKAAADPASAEPAPAITSPKPTEKDDSKPAYDVITRDGVKSVPVENLITTYQQFGDLQRRHVAVKPIFDIMEKTGLTAENIIPYLELGVKTAKEQQGGRQTQAAGTTAPTSPDGYNGPFKDAKEDAYVKDVDPVLYAAQWRLWERSPSIQPDMARRLEAIEQGFNQRVQAEQTASQEFMRQKGFEAIDQRITSWAGDKNDYFSDQKLGPQRLSGFREFLMMRFPETRIADLSPEFLSAVFAQFDPKYYSSYAERLALQKANPRLFAEGGNSRRGAPAVKLDTQQEHMADLIDI
jgi:hypothetical protein